MLRDLIVSAPHAEPRDLRGRKIVVTGASPGSIGYATARALAAWGADVVISARRQDAAATTAAALQAAAGAASRVSGHALELADAASVARFADWYTTTHGERLDALINNAGIHLDLRSQWKAPQLTPDGYELHWRTNYLGTAQLTQQLLPLLLTTAQRHGEARVINVVSQLHAKGRNAEFFGPGRPYDSWNAYGNSKLALMHLARELQRRHGDAGLRACSLHPGAVYTHIADRGLEGSAMIAAVRRILAPIECFFLLTPEEGAQTSLHCATAPDLQGGAYYVKCQPARHSAELDDAQAGARLWAATQDWLTRLAQA